MFFFKKTLTSVKSKINRSIGILQTQGSFGRNIAITFSGNTFILILGFILTPIMAKVYGPESYGQFAVFTAVCSLIIPFAGFQYPNGFVAARNRNEFFALIRMSVLSVLVVSGLSYFLVHLYVLIQNKNHTIENEIIFLIPIYVLFSGLFVVLRGINVKLKEFGIAAKAKSFANLGGKLTSVGIGTIVSQSVIGLIIGNIVLLFVESLSLLSKKLRLEIFFVSNVKIKTAEYRSAFINFKEYPTYVTINSVIHSVGTQIPIYFIALYFSEQQVGLFSLSLALILMPLNLIGNSIATVFLPKISELKDNIEQRNRVVIELYKKLFYPGVIILIFGSITLGYLVTPVLGNEWKGAGILASFIAVSFSFTLISLPLEVTYRIIGFERDNFKLNLFFILVKVIGISIGVYFQEFYLTIFCYFFAELIKNAAQVVVLFKRLSISINFIFRDLIVVAIIYSLLFHLTKT